jgi:hypothetical protein
MHLCLACHLPILCTEVETLTKTENPLFFAVLAILRLHGAGRPSLRVPRRLPLDVDRGAAVLPHPHQVPACDPPAGRGLFRRRHEHRRSRQQSERRHAADARCGWGEGVETVFVTMGRFESVRDSWNLRSLMSLRLARSDKKVLGLCTRLCRGSSFDNNDATLVVDFFCGLGIAAVLKCRPRHSLISKGFCGNSGQYLFRCFLTILYWVWR